MNRQISLFLKDGNSDKEYHAELQASGAGYVVNFRYGRRGSALKCDTKTPTPLAHADALRIYEKLVAEKIKKGYSPGAAGVPYQDTTLEARASGVLPQLLNAIDDTELNRFLQDDNFVVQEKYDGMRVLIRVDGGAVEAYNRRGLRIALPAPVALEALRVMHSALIDGELVGTRYYAFDLLESNGRCMRPRSYRERRVSLSGIVSTCHPDVIVAATTYASQREKHAALEDIRARGREGIVFKHDGAPYITGRPNSGGSQLKYKLVASATCRVANASTDRRSVSLELSDEAGTWRSVGKVTIPSNHAVPAAGVLVEIRYLYAFKDGALFQPVYCGPRDDAENDAATLSQLKYKPDDERESAA